MVKVIDNWCPQDATRYAKCTQLDIYDLFFRIGASTGSRGCEQYPWRWTSGEDINTFLLLAIIIFCYPLYKTIVRKGGGCRRRTERVENTSRPGLITATSRFTRDIWFGFKVKKPLNRYSWTRPRNWYSSCPPSLQTWGLIFLDLVQKNICNLSCHNQGSDDRATEAQAKDG